MKSTTIKRIWRGWTIVEVRFVTVMTFDDWEAVRGFAGGDGRGSVVPPQARALLSRFDEHSAHFEVVGDHPASPTDRHEPGSQR